MAERAIGDVDGKQMILAGGEGGDRVGVGAGPPDDVHRLRFKVDDRSADDAPLFVEVFAVDVYLMDGAGIIFDRRAKRDWAPEQIATVGVVGIDVIAHRAEEDDVVDRAAGKAEIGYEKGLRFDATGVVGNTKRK